MSLSSTLTPGRLFSAMLALTGLGAAPAWAGYGDVGDDGLPSAAERELHLWTNAARVDPAAFKADYQAGGCSFDGDFSADEQTPKLPVYWDHGLNDAARFHSDDMESTGNFAHESSDGTSFGDRLSRFYDSGWIGENIAYGYGDNYSVVFTGWMCSTSGHRANIMSGDWNELGTGVVGTYYTQDFGAGTVDSTGAVAMGAHSPLDATATATFRADWQDAAAPALLEVVVDGVGTALSLEYGEDTAGIFAAELTPEASDCHAYWFRWETESGATGAFPETGSYVFGPGCPEENGWRAEQAGADDGGEGKGEGGEQTVDDFDALGADLDDGGAPKLVGCATSGAPAWALPASLAGLLALTRRRRRA
ncbi:MAG: CAP domain-containing protein [Deltaproteobacteria bacterium]|nr:CAP domain-containing protein [Deltaproteobacteria bacterium]